jgi:hypothetical protein
MLRLIVTVGCLIIAALTAFLLLPIFIVTDVAGPLITGLGTAYWLSALIILSVGCCLYVAGRRAIQTRLLRRLLICLAVALAFAPSILGFDLGVVTLPAPLVALLAFSSGYRPVVVGWSILSIFCTWVLAFGVWTLLCQALPTRNRP